MSEPIIFLDFDGVISSHRAYAAQEDRWYGEQRALRWIDPIACDLVLRLVLQFGCKIVVSSTWRRSEKDCRQVLGRYELAEHLHDDWRAGEDPQRFRGNEVRQWLNEHGHPTYIIFDDDSDFDAEQEMYLVKTDGLNGLLLSHYELAEKLLQKISGGDPK